MVRESNGNTPRPGAEIVLCLDGDGTASLVAMMADAAPVYDTGTYQVTGDRFSITLPALHKSAANQPYRLNGDTLVLPFAPLSSRSGVTSTWKRRPVQAGPVPTAFETFDDDVDKGAAAVQAADDAARQVERRYPRQVKDARAAPDGSALAIDYTNGTRGYVVYETRPDGIEGGTPRGPRRHPWSADPRTLRPQIGARADDNPATPSVTLFLPFQSAPFAAYPPGLWSKLKRVFWHSTSPPWHPDSFNEPVDTYLAILTKKAGLAKSNVRVYQDDTATPWVLYNEIVNRHVGLLYMSTHSAQADATTTVVLTGVFLGPDADTAALRAWLAHAKPSLPAQYVVLEPKPNPTLGTASIEFVRAGHHSIDGTFVAVTSAFFAKMRGNLDRSLVFANSCSSGKSATLARAFGAKAFLGWKTEISVGAATRIAEHVFETLSRQTRSAREAVDRVKAVTSKQFEVYPEDELLLDLPPTTAAGPGGPVFVEPGQSFVGYGNDFREYPPINPTVTLLLHIARWSQDPQTGVNSLEDSCRRYWCVGNEPPPGAVFAVQGTLGSHLPTDAEVRDATQLLDGTPRPIPQGRFTLNDGHR